MFHLEPTMPFTPLFDPFQLASIKLKNRTVVAPMTRVSATEEGNVSELMLPYYRAFADGGFAAVITEGVYTDKHHSQGYRYQPGLADIEQAASWAKLIKEVHDAGSRVIVQLMHAGALSQYNRFVKDTRAPSPVSPKGSQMEFYRGEGAYPTPQEFVPAEIETALKGFADSARRAQDAGADGVEVHGANGYLLKGSGLSDLVQAIRSVATGDAFFSPEVAKVLLEDSREEQKPDPLAALTKREREVLVHVAEGKSSPEIAKLLGLSVKTVEGHRGRIMAKLDIRNVAGLVRYAIKVGLIDAG